MGTTTDLELERAKQLLERLRTDSLKAWLHQSVRNKQLRDDVLELPGALAVVLGRLQLRMNQQEAGVLAKAMMASVLDELEHGEIDAFERDLVFKRLSDDYGANWKSSVRGWSDA